MNTLVLLDNLIEIYMHARNNVEKLRNLDLHYLTFKDRLELKKRMDVYDEFISMLRWARNLAEVQMGPEPEEAEGV